MKRSEIIDLESEQIMEREQRSIDETLTLKFWEPFLRMAHSDGCPGLCPIKVLYGKSNDKPLVFNDLDEAENLLLYGTTGSGKSTFVHVFIKSAMMFNTIEDARFVLVDFKRVEFNQYKNRDLLLCPVIQGKESLVYKLNDLIGEINHRKSIIGEGRFENYRRNHNKSFPYIVIVIDDYSAVGDADVDLLLQQILKDGHKYGVHVVISTQSLHESIICDETINLFKTKICFNNYREEEAEKIIGKYIELDGEGDMVFFLNGELKRVQGLYTYTCENLDAMVDESRYCIDDWLFDKLAEYNDYVLVPIDENGEIVIANKVVMIYSPNHETKADKLDKHKKIKIRFWDFMKRIKGKRLRIRLENSEFVYYSPTINFTYSNYRKLFRENTKKMNDDIK